MRSIHKRYIIKIKTVLYMDQNQHFKTKSKNEKINLQEVNIIESIV